MLTLTPQMRVFVAIEPIDFRNGIDGLAGICRNRLGSDPFTGGVYVFRNRGGTSLKILVYDGQGFWLCQKRLSSGRFVWCPKGGAAPLHALESRQLQLLLWNGDPERASLGALWRRLEG